MHFSSLPSTSKPVGYGKPLRRGYLSRTARDRCAAKPSESVPDIPILGDVPEWDPNPSPKTVAQMDAEDLALMERDLLEYASTSTSKPANPVKPVSSPSASQEDSGGWKEVVDKILIVDFFFVCVILLWLIAGLGERAALESSNLLDAWFPLWPVVFQPALGVLMLGALASGAAAKLSEGKE